MVLSGTSVFKTDLFMWKYYTETESNYTDCGQLFPWLQAYSQLQFTMGDTPHTQYCSQLTNHNQE